MFVPLRFSRWGQVYILDALATYAASDVHEAGFILERVSAHLQHSNGAVVLASVRVLIRQFEVCRWSCQQFPVHKFTGGFRICKKFLQIADIVFARYITWGGK